ncbi:hypothetical protein WG66_004153 [Moniliophthora roreri]|nr:hypothetical protein WG66_004153 [Moniliophthora roreri]
MLLGLLVSSRDLVIKWCTSEKEYFVNGRSIKEQLVRFQTPAFVREVLGTNLGMKEEVDGCGWGFFDGVFIIVEGAGSCGASGGLYLQVRWLNDN